MATTKFKKLGFEVVADDDESVYLRIDTRDGEISFVAREKNDCSRPESVVNGNVLWFDMPSSVGERAYEDLLGKLRPLVDELVDECQDVCGRCECSERGDELAEEIAELIEKRFSELDVSHLVITAAYYVGNIDISPEATDEELKKLAEGFEKEAKSDGYLLQTNMLEHLEERRENARSE